MNRRTDPELARIPDEENEATSGTSITSYKVSLEHTKGGGGWKMSWVSSWTWTIQVSPHKESPPASYLGRKCGKKRGGKTKWSGNNNSFKIRENIQVLFLAEHAFHPTPNNRKHCPTWRLLWVSHNALPLIKQELKSWSQGGDTKCWVPVNRGIPLEMSTSSN